MKIAIMQPYFFPYLGYFQLIQSADKFIIYDDVSYIKRGWINRNNFLVNGKKGLITIPLSNGKRGMPICEVEVAGKREYWARKILKTIQQSYAKAPNFDPVYQLFEEALQESSNLISEINVKALKLVCDYLGIETEIVETSRCYGNGDLSASERVIDICKKEEAEMYINASGGRSLYSSEDFLEQGLELRFLKPELPIYRQLGGNFEHALSIVDLLMYVDSQEVLSFSKTYTLES